MTTTITAQEKTDTAIENILDREAEVEHYQVNIDNYIEMLKVLPTAWPENLDKFKGMTSQEIAVSVDLADVELVSDLIFRDKVDFLLRTEIMEQRKALHVYNAVVIQQDSATLQTKLDAAKIARKANAVEIS